MYLILLCKFIENHSFNISFHHIDQVIVQALKLNNSFKYHFFLRKNILNVL